MQATALGWLSHSPAHVLMVGYTEEPLLRGTGRWLSLQWNRCVPLSAEDVSIPHC